MSTWRSVNGQLQEFPDDLERGQAEPRAEPSASLPSVAEEILTPVDGTVESAIKPDEEVRGEAASSSTEGEESPDPSPDPSPAPHMVPKVIWENVPRELRDQDQWVLWRFETRKGKKTKPPFSAPGQYAKVNDPATWLSFAEAQRLYEAGGFDGVGYVLTPDDGLTGVDLDHCRNPETGVIQSWAQYIAQRLASYTEITPSRTGLRVWVRAMMAGGGRRKGHIEVYSDLRYLTTTGNHVEGAPTTIAARQSELDALVTEVFEEGTARVKTPNEPPAWEGEDLIPEEEQAIQERLDRDERFSSLWSGDWSGYSSQSEADLAFCNMLREILGPDPAKIDVAFRRSGLMRPKWERPDYRQRTIGKALKSAAASPQVDGADDSADQSEEPTSAPFVVPEPVIPLLDGSRLLRDFVGLVHDLAPGLPKDWAIMAFLAGVSVLVPHIRIQNLGLNLWFLGIGVQSAGKGLLVDAVRHVIRAAGKVLSVGEVVPFKPFTSGTPQALMEESAKAPVLVVFEEASKFMEQADRLDTQAAIKQTLCELYDGRELAHVLRKNSIYAEHPYVSMVAAINQPDFVRTVRQEDCTSGFLSRMLFVAADLDPADPVHPPAWEEFDDLGRRLGEHLKRLALVKRAQIGEVLLGGSVKLGEIARHRTLGHILLYRLFADAGLINKTGQHVNLDHLQDDDGPQTPVGRDKARTLKLAALFELLADEPTIEVDEGRGDEEAGVDTPVLAVSRDSILCGVSVAVRGRAYAHRAMKWLSTSADLAEQKRIVTVIGKHPGISESRLMDHVRSRGAVYMKRNLEMLERSGEIRKVQVERGRGYRYYPGRWSDEKIRGFGGKVKPQ